MNKIKVFAKQYGDQWQYHAYVVEADAVDEKHDSWLALAWQWIGEFETVKAFQSYFHVAWGSFPCPGMTFFLNESPAQLEAAWKTPYQFGDVLVVRREPGRIERSYFVVQNANKVRGGGFRYDGVFPGAPLLYGKVYSEDVVCRHCRIPEAQCAALTLKASCQEQNGQTS